MTARSVQGAQTSRYGVLVGRLKDGVEDGGKSPRYEIWVQGGGDFRIAVNVRSVDGSEVLAHYDPAYTPPASLDLAALAAGPAGFTAIATGPNGKGLDCLRDNLLPIADMSPLPPDGSGVNLRNLLDGQIERAKADGAAVVVAFGQYFNKGADETFKFSPEQGIHDIHMMQGNSGKFASDNQIRGDGALFIRFGDGETMALFVRFDTQAITTA
ncbi:MAG: hypothetical protein JWO51_4163 [Rhodospirillales bacterium]|nr:hypothetical protein [Rhodospirillales bacterium]